VTGAHLSGDDRAAVLAMASIPSVGPKRLRAALALGPPARTWQRLVAGHGPTMQLCGLDHRPPPDIDPETIRDRHAALGMELLVPGDPGWPAALVDDPEPPVFLLTSARLPPGPAVAIVGTRRCTGYGRAVAARLGSELAEAGVVVVSGLAAGIDAAAQRAAYDTGGAPVVAVIGSGPDVVYPRRNERLWRDLASGGVIVGETPAGGQPLRWRFPARNRIIAALSDVVVVVESRAKGGSMHTVDAAQERDRPVMAVPGPITSPASAGTNGLLAEGCAPVCDTDDILVALGLAAAERPSCSLRLDPADAQLLDALGWEPSTVDEVVQRSGLGLAEVSRRLAELSVRGVVRDTGGWWERVAAR
jgi:DNA processing protein